MDPYQAYKRGLITQAQYEKVKNEMNIDVTGILERPVVSVHERVINENTVWNVLPGQTVLGVIGPDNDFINEGTINIRGEVVLLNVGDRSFVSIAGTVNLGSTGTLMIKDI